MEKAVSGIVLILLILISPLTLALNIHPVRAWSGGTVYIMADGSVYPPDAPISTVDYIAYILTGDINSYADGIVVERDNIIINGAGYTLQGPGYRKGIDLSGRTNVTVQNIQINSFYSGVWLYGSSKTALSEIT
jgi:hypothetical protein